MVLGMVIRIRREEYGFQLVPMVMVDHIGMFSILTLVEIMIILCLVVKLEAKMIKYKLICKNINFNSLGDKVVFFEWANKIDCIDKILELPDELCFFVKDVMDKDDLKDRKSVV